MAISPLLEQEDAKLIVHLLLNSKKTVGEINEHLLKNEKVSISTATLYRRVKELTLAGFIEKLDSGSYTTTELGKKTYNEIFGQITTSNDGLNNLSDLLRQISHKESYILHKINQKPTYTSGLLQEISISPNELVEIFKILTQYNLIEVVEKPGKKPGRPKKMYKISQTGILLIQEIEKLKQKLRETR